MATTKEQATTDVQILNADEAFEVFNYQARKLMGMSGEEFLRRWEAGEYAGIADTPGNRHIMRLALMIPLARQNS